MFHCICKKFAESHLKVKAIISTDSVGVIKIAYKKIRIESHVQRVISTYESSAFLAANNIPHTAVKKELLVLPKNSKNSCKMFGKTSYGLDCKHVQIFSLFQFANLVLVAANGNNAAIMKPSIFVDCVNDGVAIHISRRKIQNFYFRKFIIDIVNDLICIRKKFSRKIGAVKLTCILNRIYYLLVC